MSPAPSFGSTDLPPEQSDALRRAKRLEVVTLAILAVTVVLMALVMGNSQAMRAAWIEDMLSFLPPIAFLVAARVARRQPDDSHPWGYHRATGAAHLASAIALVVMGGFLLYESVTTLVLAERPTIGTVTLAGTTVWLGWVMMAALVVTSIPPMILGRLKLGLAETLHDKVLYADADMNKADWTTALGGTLGILGIGVGWWWADAAVATFIGANILHDGVRNLRTSVRGLLDREAMTYDDSERHPVIDALGTFVAGLPWVQEFDLRVRDEGHVFHAEVFVVPRTGSVDVRTLQDAAEEARRLDLKLDDLAFIPVSTLPRRVGSGE